MVAVADDIIAQVYACRTRVCLLDADGSPLVGASSSYVSKALVTATLSPQYTDGTAITEENACGESFLNVPGKATLDRADLSLEFLSPDPYLHQILVSQGAILNPVSGGVGWQFPPIGVVETNGISVEFWAQRISGNTISDVHPYALWAIPRVKDIKLGDRTFAAAASHSLFTGHCFENANWFDGPGNDFDADSTRIAQWIPVDTLPSTTTGPAAVIAS